MSYPHADASRIAPVLEAIQELGYRFWYDRGIVAGSEWFASIAKRLQGSTAILLFLSNQAVLRDFVRMEVVHAAIIRKRILPIELENVELKDEFALSLAPIQRIKTRDAGRLRRSASSAGVVVFKHVVKSFINGG